MVIFISRTSDKEILLLLLEFKVSLYIVFQNYVDFFFFSRKYCFSAFVPQVLTKPSR